MTNDTASRWGDLFDEAVNILDQANSQSPLIDHWALGGGTGLMLQINHRESFDIDIFLDDPQLLPYLNPQTQGYTIGLRLDAHVSDGARALKLVFQNIGEIDFICAAGLTSNTTAKARIRGRDILLETPAEIIAKKIFYRGASMQPRDMFDIACVMKILGTKHVIEAISPFADRCAGALHVARQMNPRFAEVIMSKLLYRERFSDIPSQAQAMTIDVLETVC